MTGQNSHQSGTTVTVNGDSVEVDLGSPAAPNTSFSGNATSGRPFSGFGEQLYDSEVENHIGSLGLFLGQSQRTVEYRREQLEDALSKPNPDQEEINLYSEELLDQIHRTELLSHQINAHRSGDWEDFYKARAAQPYADKYNITLNQAVAIGAVYKDENGRYQPYSFEDGDPGDNFVGDQVGYDYTRDLDPTNPSDYTTNEDGLTSRRPEARPTSDEGDAGHSGIKPIIIDLDGDGIEIVLDRDVSFDIDGDGFLERSAWVSPDDAFLVLDLDENGQRGLGDGKVDQVRELAFSLWGEPGDTDLMGLARAFDDNLDGKLTSGGNGDSVWGELKVWQDINFNGIVDEGELASLNERGITEIGLSYDNGFDFREEISRYSFSGTHIFGLSSYVVDGEIISGGIADVSLATTDLGWRSVSGDGYYDVEFEAGELLRYLEMEYTDPKDVMLTQSSFSGVEADSRDNELNAFGRNSSVQLHGGAGNDTLLGGNVDDLLIGAEGNDELRGYGGNDTLFFDNDDYVFTGGAGRDTAIFSGSKSITINMAEHEVEVVVGGEGSDTIIGSGSSASYTIDGQSGSDSVVGGSSDDFLLGAQGDDTVEGLGGDDFVSGGAGPDVLRGGAGDDIVYGNDGNDHLNGEGGDDRLYGNDGNDVFWGSTGDDYLDGGEGQDTLRGASGDDRLYGRNGNDLLEGGDGDDRLYGGDGWDQFHDGNGDDYAEGGAGSDLFVDAEGDDVFLGQEGNDTFRLATYSGNNVVMGGVGSDRLVLSGTADQWSWEYVRETYQVQTGVTDGGQGEGQPIYETRVRGEGQYLFWSGDTYVQVIDVETVEFAGAGRQLHWSHVDQQSSQEFALSYIASAGDLIGAFGTNWVNGSYHWTNYGQADGREVTFNPLEYLAANPDIYAAHGFNMVQVTEHYILNGHAAGRSTGDFDAEQYLRNYGDLRSAFGTDLSAATRHYISNGRFEGRTDNAISSSLSDANWNAWLNLGSTAVTTMTLDHVDAAQDNEDTFYWAQRLNETDPNATIYGRYTRADSIDGGSGNDLIQADNVATGGHWLYETTPHQTDGRNDTVDGGDGADTVEAGVGDDVVAGGSGSDVVAGNTGDDVLDGNAGGDLIEGGEGNDTINGHDGADLLRGGVGNDVIGAGAGADIVYGGDGADVINGAWGSDYLSGGNGWDSIYGGDGADEIVGGNGNDSLNGQNGSDRLEGGDGVDTLLGGLGDDRLEGDRGWDSLDGGHGNDYILAGDGNDHASGGSGQDALFGGIGDDILSGQADNDILYGEAGADKLYGGDENDVLNGGLGGDTLDGGNGIDTASYADATSRVFVRLNNAGPEHFQGEAVGDYLVSIENVYGSRFNDILAGTSGDNVFWGDAGDDQFWGAGGNDDIFGGDGNDVLRGHQGQDRLTGGAGVDTFVFYTTDGGGNDVITDFEDNIDRIDLRYYEFSGAAYVVQTHGTRVGDDVIFDFGGGDTLTVYNTTLAEIQNDLLI